jgi:flavodoxin
MSKKALVVYYSWSNGNTQKIAELVQKELGADIARIETVVPYSGSYDDVVNQGQDEVVRGYQPEIKPLDVNLADYDTVVVGTPTWWYTMAPAMLTFLSANNWSGKTIIPFQTHGGWPGHVIEDMKQVCKGASFQHEKAIQFDSTGGDRMVTSQKELDKWLADLKG